MVLVAGYLLWAGADAPGGAFQAGVVLGALGILLSLADRHPLAHLPGWALRLAVVAGPMGFLTVGVTMMARGGRFLEYPQAYAKPLIFVIEAAAMISIGVILFFLYTHGRPSSDGQGTRKDFL
jgi:multisubunit Na+/H+ antiporter MnhB subunit